MPIWKDTLRQLERSKHGEIVHSAIKLCYDKLDSIEAKKLLLLCALHEEDENIKLEDLMRYCWGQIDMFKDAYTLQEARDRVYRWVDLLKDRCLLLDGNKPGTVKMHDVIRDISLSIAKQSHGMHCFRDGCEVEEFLKEKKSENLKAVLLPDDYLEELEFENLEYSQLHSMILRNQRLELPGDFLDRTKELKGLDLNGMNSFHKISKIVLGPHLSCLQNLRTLRLQNYKVEGIAKIGNLMNLEILDLFGCKNTELPGEIGQLTCLQMLDLRESLVEVIEPNVIMHMKRLEELYLPKCMKWHEVDEVENNNSEKRNASLDELKHLDRLTALHLVVNNIKVLPKVLVSQKLENYQIFIGQSGYFSSEHSNSRKLWVNHESSSFIRDHGLEMLVQSAEELQLQGLDGMKSIVSKLETGGFPELKRLEFFGNSTVEYLVDTSMEKIHPSTVCESLEELTLHSVSHLKQICHGEVSAESFRTLRVVEVRYSPDLKNIFPLFNFRQLEKIVIVNCKEMGEVFSHEIQEDNVDDDDNEKSIVEFPQLPRLELNMLPKLREFMSFDILNKKTCSSQKRKEPFVGDSVTPLFNGMVTMGIGLKCRISNTMHLMEEQEESSQQQPQTLVFPYLTDLQVDSCHGLKKLVPSFISFRNLNSLKVTYCKGMLHLLSSQTAKSMTQLKILKMIFCERMESIICDEGVVDSVGGGEIVFTMLEELRLRDLPRLSNFYSGNCSIGFPHLEEFKVKECLEMQSFSKHSFKISHPKLKHIKIGKNFYAVSESKSESSSNWKDDINSAIGNVGRAATPMASLYSIRRALH